MGCSFFLVFSVAAIQCPAELRASGSTTISCMYVCMHAYMHVYVHIRTSMFSLSLSLSLCHISHTLVYVSMCVQVDLYTSAYSRISKYTHAWMRECMYMCFLSPCRCSAKQAAHTHTHTHKHTNTHTHARAHTHTHKHVNANIRVCIYLFMYLCFPSPSRYNSQEEVSDWSACLWAVLCMYAYACLYLYMLVYNWKCLSCECMHVCTVLMSELLMFRRSCVAVRKSLLLMGVCVGMCV
jgi:hypothetical protein